MSSLWGLVGQLRWQDALDIAIVAFVVYHIILLLKGTRAMHMLFGLGLVVVVWAISGQLQLVTTHWLIQSFLSSIVLVLIILFQADIRRALARVGRRPAFGAHYEQTASSVEEVVRAAVVLAARMTGALIVLERRIGLAEYMRSAVRLDARVSRELLVSIFQVSGPLHDGAVVISEGKVVAARCMLPLAANPPSGREFGTRHRAAIGLSQETDAAVVVVSEERGWISLAVEGRLKMNMDAGELEAELKELMGITHEPRPWWRVGRRR